MKAIGVFTLLGLFSSQLHSMPTAEGLFRNSNNKELTGNLIVVTAMVEPIIAQAEIAATQVEEAAIVQPKPSYYKWLMSLERENHIDLIQVTYNNSQLKENQVVFSRYLPDVKRVVADDNSLERSLFYGLLGTLVLNDSQLLAPTLSKYSQGFVANKELMSRDKVELYRQYKDYLEKKQKEDNVEANSPLKPENPELAKLVQETLAAPMYRNAENVKLIRVNNNLMWEVDLKNIVAYFSNEDHRLSRLDYQSPLGDLSLKVDDYVLFDGAHELPKTLIINDMSGKSWRVKFLGLSHINNRNTAFTKRAQDYATAAKNNQGTTESEVQQEIVSPPFVF